MHGPSAESFTSPAMHATRDYALLWRRLSPTKRNALALSALLTGPAFGCSWNSTKSPSFPTTEKQMTAWQKLPTLIQKILSSTTGTRTCDSFLAGTSHGLTTISSMFRLEHMSSSALTSWCMERSGSGFKCSRATQPITSQGLSASRRRTVMGGRTAETPRPWPFYHPVIPTMPPPSVLQTCMVNTMARAGLIASLSSLPSCGYESPETHRWWTSSLRSMLPYLLTGHIMMPCWPQLFD